MSNLSGSQKMTTNDKIIIEDNINKKIIDNNQNLEKTPEKSILSLYEPEKDVSLNTYNNKVL